MLSIMSETLSSVHTQPARSEHTFHIPVMGTGFSIDTPIRVAQYGISSVISLVDDALIEQMREFYCHKLGRHYAPILREEEDARARRITAYLNLVNDIVTQRVEELQTLPFEPGSPITRYYEMLPETPLKRDYRTMLASTCTVAKRSLQDSLRDAAVPGSIDVNIMTKLDRAVFANGQQLPREFNDAMAALRGYAKSDLCSAIVLSAGMNPALYGYMAEFPDFYPDEQGLIRKRIILKVSDYRSAVIQGKYLAKRGLWVSEYRVESGLNCGGHAFSTKGYLMGPILEEFKKNKQELAEMLHAVLNRWRVRRDLPPFAAHPDLRITVQGGIGTVNENEFLLKYYNVDATGWGTPFLLVPEVANVDEDHLEKLVAATNKDVFLSSSSPLGIPFWNLHSSASEEARRQRIHEGCPGANCTKGILSLNTDFTTVPICRASHTYQTLKLEAIDKAEAADELTADQAEESRQEVLAKSCICCDLGGSTQLRYGIEPEATPAICCGPNIRYFSAIATLEQMVGHIYGRLSLLTSSERPHMFIEELRVYVDHLSDEARKLALGLAQQKEKYYHEFKDNLLEGVEYYTLLAGQIVAEQRERFLADLQALRSEIEAILPVPADT